MAVLMKLYDQLQWKWKIDHIINRPKRRHGHKYVKYSMSVSSLNS